MVILPLYPYHMTVATSTLLHFFVIFADSNRVTNQL